MNFRQIVLATLVILAGCSKTLRFRQAALAAKQADQVPGYSIKFPSMPTPVRRECTLLMQFPHYAVDGNVIPAQSLWRCADNTLELLNEEDHSHHTM
jgi:hypothetical protein